jgi:hypothetical protein
VRTDVESVGSAFIKGVAQFNLGCPNWKIWCNCLQKIDILVKTFEKLEFISDCFVCHNLLFESYQGDKTGVSLTNSTKPDGQLKMPSTTRHTLFTYFQSNLGRSFASSSQNTLTADGRFILS